MNKPSISVILPVFNGERHLKEAIQSILDQSFKNFEFIIIDDGSTDTSKQIIDKFSSTDNRIVPISRTNKGLVKTLNEGIERAQYDLIARMDADDICHPERFRKQIEAFVNNPRLTVIGSNTTIISEDGEIIRNASYPQSNEAIIKFVQKGSPFAHPAVMYKKEAIVHVGGYREAYKHCEDYDLWLRLYEQNYSFLNLPDNLLYYRQSLDGISLSNSQHQSFATLIAKMTSKMRIDGLEDPIKDNKIIDETILNEIPSTYKVDYIAQKFIQDNINISLQHPSQIRETVKLSRDLNLKPKYNTPFLLRCAFGMLKKSCYNEFITYLVQSFLTSPSEFLKVIINQLRKKL